MLIKIDKHNKHIIKNTYFSNYLKIYEEIHDDFLGQVENLGITVDQNFSKETQEKLEVLRQKGAVFRNNDKSIYVNWLSPACEACAKGKGSVTLYTSLICNRDCYFCFNPNQEQYEYFLHNKKDCTKELEQMHQNNDEVLHLGLSGGEPLVHKEDTIQFFKRGHELFPQAHTRMYTAGDFVDEEILEELKQAGLQEIRFSIKMDDPLEIRQKIYNHISLAKKYIPQVMVEMPIFPDKLTETKSLLLDLDKLGIDGINLLEFCFPFNNANEFTKRGYKIKNPPVEVFYDYSYAAGLPISKSELVCLDLLEFIIENNLQIGAHYCSLENKLTEQVYKQNYGQKASPLMIFSEKDFFYKSAKVFGKDIEKTVDIFKKYGITEYSINEHYQFLEFNISNIKLLKNLNIEIGISSNIIESRENEKYLRELKIDLTYPEKFDVSVDI